jgi:hypothetical protein
MVHEFDLAWALANTAAVYLDTAGRHDLYITLGVGETFAAISLLIAVIAREKAELPVHLMPDLMRWLDIYAGHEDEPRLRTLVEQIGSHPPPG